MKSLKDDLIIYNRALQQGSMQRAYRGILTFMGDLNRSWKQKHPERSVHLGIEQKTK